jgi:hypothetical protein
VVLGLAIACKVTPALFVPYLLWKRSWRALAGCAVGLALFLYPGLVPSLRLGWEENQRQLRSWYGVMVRPFVVEGKVTSEHNNQSLPGLVARLATPSPSFSTYQGNVYTPTRYDNLLSLSPRRAAWLVKGCLALFALVVAWACSARTTTPQSWRLAAEHGLVLLGMLLFSERTWKHHCVTLALPLAVVCYCLAWSRPGARRAWLGGTLAVVFGLLLVTGVGSGKDSPTALGKQAQLYGAYTLACLLLTGTLVFLLRKSPAPAHSPGGGTETALP